MVHCWLLMMVEGKCGALLTKGNKRSEGTGGRSKRERPKNERNTDFLSKSFPVLSVLKLHYSLTLSLISYDSYFRKVRRIEKRGPQGFHPIYHRRRSRSGYD